MPITTAPVDDRSTSPDEPLTAPRGHLGDTAFKGVSVGSGMLILAMLAAVAAFLIVQAVPSFLGQAAYPNGTSNILGYVAPYLFGTVWASALALLLAVPVAVGIALFISHYAPRRLATPVAFVIDLLAAVPSIVFGLWGILVLAPLLRPGYVWLNEHLGFIPLFGGQVSGTGRTMLTAAFVLAIMILPIITSLCREVFLRTPRLQEQASLALGATKWEMIQQVVLPFGRSGMVSAAMLGLGRALGETMAVAMVLSPGRLISFQMLTPNNPNTIASNIALYFPEADTRTVPTLIATGLVLFVLTFVVNFAGRAIVTDGAPRHRNGKRTAKEAGK